MAKDHKKQDEVEAVEMETLTEEEQDEILRKYDPESNTRDLGSIFRKIVFFGLLAFSLFQLYTAIFGQYTAYIQRSIHLGFALSLIFILFPARKRLKKEKRGKVPFYDLILASLSVVVGLYWPLNIEKITGQVGRLTDMDLIVGIIAIILTLEAARRAVGVPITIISSLFLVYAFFGSYFPGFLNHRGQDVKKVLSVRCFIRQTVF